MIGAALAITLAIGAWRWSSGTIEAQRHAADAAGAAVAPARSLDGGENAGDPPLARDVMLRHDPGQVILAKLRYAEAGCREVSTTGRCLKDFASSMDTLAHVRLNDLQIQRQSRDSVVVEAPYRAPAEPHATAELRFVRTASGQWKLEHVRLLRSHELQPFG